MKKKFLKTFDNIKIAINHIETNSREVLIVVPGWFMTKDSQAFLRISEAFGKFFDVISFDCRGHGESGGFYTFSAKETLDLKAVVDYAKEKYEKIYLIGFSLGGAIVLIHAAEDDCIDKVIAVSAPFDFDKIENKMWKKEAWLETFKKFEIKRCLSVRPASPFLGKTRPADVVDKISAPTLFVAGKKDPTVYAWHSEELFKKAKCKKKFELFEEGLHAEDLFLKEEKRFMNICISWLQN